MSAGHPLERHDRHRTGVLGDPGLLGGDHVHDHPAAQHVGQAALDGERPGLPGARVRSTSTGGAVDGAAGASSMRRSLLPGVGRPRRALRRPGSRSPFGQRASTRRAGASSSPTTSHASRRRPASRAAPPSTANAWHATRPVGSAATGTGGRGLGHEDERVAQPGREAGHAPPPGGRCGTRGPARQGVHQPRHREERRPRAAARPRPSWPGRCRPASRARARGRARPRGTRGRATPADPRSRRAPRPRSCARAPGPGGSSRRSRGCRAAPRPWWRTARRRGSRHAPAPRRRRAARQGRAGRRRVAPRHSVNHTTSPAHAPATRPTMSRPTATTHRRHDDEHHEPGHRGDEQRARRRL